MIVFLPRSLFLGAGGETATTRCLDTGVRKVSWQAAARRSAENRKGRPDGPRQRADELDLRADPCFSLLSKFKGSSAGMDLLQRLQRHFKSDSAVCGWLRQPTHDGGSIRSIWVQEGDWEALSRELEVEITKTS